MSKDHFWHYVVVFEEDLVQRTTTTEITCAVWFLIVFVFMDCGDLL